ncbi:MAG: hypothetical protein J6T71_05155 [Paludibacteraceae bacterium]|nr:hypothetical protein [Paludibacteraceae bacterium]
MIEWFRHIIDWINANAGVFSLLAVIATCVGIYVSVRIHRSKKEEELQQMQDRYDEMERLQSVAWPSDVKDKVVEKEVLKKAIKRGRK